MTQITEIRTFLNTIKKTKAVVQFESEWEEYQVLFYKNGRLQKDATYHTDDLEDAFGTAKVMVE